MEKITKKEFLKLLIRLGKLIMESLGSPPRKKKD